MLLTTEALPATMRPTPGVHECGIADCPWAQEPVQSDA